MATTKSAKKRMKTSRAKHETNKSLKTRIKTARRNLTDAVAAKDRAAGEKAYRLYCSAVDKAVKRGTIKANNADRRKSRGSALLASCG